MADEGEESYESLASHARAIKGDEVFADRILREAGEKPLRRWGLTEVRVATEVARILGLELARMKNERRDREGSRARIVAAYLGREIGAIPVSRMARYFDRDETTLVRGVLNLEEKLQHDAALRRQLLRMSDALRTNNT